MKFKFVICLVFSVLSFMFLASPAHAQVSNNYFLNTNPDVPQNFHSYTQNVLIELAAAASCQISGIDPINPGGKCLGIDSKTGRIGFVEGGGGLIGITGNLIAQTFDIPVSSSQYVKYLADNFGIAKKTFAQDDTNPGPEFDTSSGTSSAAFENGVGFNGLNKLLPLWKVFRNVIYTFFVLVFVIVGVGIMFRIKIDPRTVMTIQNQIPKIIIALVLVTFSYAIAGFLIDMMYVLMYLIYNIIASSGLIDPSGLSPAKMQGSNPLSAIGFLGGVGIAFNAAFGLGSIISHLFDGTTGQIIATIVLGIVGGAAGGMAGSFIGAAIGGITGIIGGAVFGGKILGVVGGLVAFIVISAALLTALFRLWFQLLKTYISILINIVLAPFWIAGGLIPGSPISFSGWLRDMIANLISFPTVLFMLLIGKVFIDAFSSGGSNFAPPFIGNPGDTEHFGALIGLGIILLTPNVVNLVRQALKAPSTKITAGIGQSIGIGAGIAGAPARSVGNRLWGVDPYTKEPRFLTERIQRGLGRWTSRAGPIGKAADLASKVFPTVMGMRKEVGKEIVAEEQRASAERAAKKRGVGGTPGGGATTPPTTPPPETPPTGGRQTH